MSVPEAYAVTILHNDVDITNFCDYKYMDLDDHVYNVSSLRLTIENPDVIPVKNDIIFVYAPNLPTLETIFKGYIVEVNEKRHGIVSHYEVECADNKIRLQKSVTPTKLYADYDNLILADLLADTEPDLSDVFDFETAVNNVAEALLQANEDSLLDLLRELQDRTGAKPRFDRPPGRYFLDFDGGGNIDSGVGTYATMRRRTWDSFVDDNNGSVVTTDAIVIGDGPDASDCYKWAGTAFNSSDFVAIVIGLGSSVVIENITFDLYFDLAGRDLIVGTPSFGSLPSFSFTIDSSESGQWLEIDALARGIDLPNPQNTFLWISFLPASSFTAAWEVKIDNIRVTLRTRAMKDELVWDDELEDSPFDLDIQNSAEYASDIDFSIGGYDDFNGVVVIGGKLEENIEWVVDADGQSTIIQAPRPVVSPTLALNTGNDTTPSWVNVELGTWGVDTLGAGIPAIEALYDPNYHWFLFQTAPPNLTQSIRISGRVQVPFRLKIEDTASADEPVFLTTIEDETIDSYETATQIGLSQLNKRKAMRRLEFTTYNPGLKVGKKMTVVDSARGLNESIMINRIQVEWLGSSGHARFHVYCGEDGEMGIDSVVAGTDQRSRKKKKAYEAGTVTIAPLVDTTGIMLVDTTGTLLVDS